MSLINSTVFNTNPACKGVGPAEVARNPYKTLQFVLSILAIVFMFATSIFMLYHRRFKRRLRLRSPVPIVISSVSGMVLIGIRSSYDLIGREHMPCLLNLVLWYMMIPIMFLPDILSASIILSKQYNRHLLNDNTFQTIVKQPSEVAHSRTGPQEYLHGLWNLSMNVLAIIWCFKFDSQRWKYVTFRKVSAAREISYETIILLSVCVPFAIALGARYAELPQFHPANACTGCQIGWEDVTIPTVVVATMALPFTVLMYNVHAFRIPDPLYLLHDIRITVVIGAPFFLCNIVLVATDPNGLMKDQTIDWHIFEMIGILIMHCQRTLLQLYRTRRMHKLGERSIHLLDVLADPRSSILFERHLIGELANENLLFWREAIKYKQNFDKTLDLDYSQETAKVLWRTFISPYASLPINISESHKKRIDHRFKGVVGKSVFDEALVEVYFMMQNGAFQRFIRSEAFKEYASTKADYSMKPTKSVAIMAVTPSLGNEDEDEEALSTINNTAEAFDINQYIKGI